MSSRFHAWAVPADSNLISFGRLYRSSIDHHRLQTLINTQSARVVNLGAEGTPLRDTGGDCQSVHGRPQSIFAPESLIALAHLAISATMWRLNASRDSAAGVKAS